MTSSVNLLDVGIDPFPQRAMAFLSEHFGTSPDLIAMSLHRCWTMLVATLIVLLETEEGSGHLYSAVMTDDVDVRFIQDIERYITNISGLKAVEVVGAKLALKASVPELGSFVRGLCRPGEVTANAMYTLTCVALLMLLCKLKRSLIANDGPPVTLRIILAAAWSCIIRHRSVDIILAIKQDCAAAIAGAMQFPLSRAWEILECYGVMSNEEIKATIDSTRLPQTHQSLLDRFESALSSGNFVRAAVQLEYLDLAPDECDGLLLRSRLCQMLGKKDEACSLIDRALSADPKSQNAVVAKAQYALSTSRLQDAHQWFERAWTINEKVQSWTHQWLEVMILLGHLDESIRVAEKCCSSVPDDGESWFWLGYAKHLGGKLGDALECYWRCGALIPDRAMLWNNVAAIYLASNDNIAAIFYAKRALAQDGNNALAWTNLGNAYTKLGKITEAEAAVERSLTLNPNSPRTLQVFSYVMKERGRMDKALHYIELANAAMPNDETILWSLAMLQLALGDYKQGWVNHEHRWSGSGELFSRFPALPAPMWEGQSLKGKTIYVWGEQGLGDVLQFVRFIPLLAQRAKREGGRVVFSAFSEVFRLFRRTLEDVIEEVRDASLGTGLVCDYHIPLCSIPYRLGVGIVDLPFAARYLKTNLSSTNNWRNLFRTDRKLHVGLVWTGSKTHQRNPFRAIDPRLYADVFRGIEGVTFHSLQIFEHAEAKSLGEFGLAVTDHTEKFIDFDDTAAYVANLDAVVTVCTSMAHLAGALGIRTYLLLDANPHWVWMTDRRDTPWYPSVTLYRQFTAGQWRSVVERAAVDLVVQAEEHRMTAE